MGNKYHFSATENHFERDGVKSSVYSDGAAKGASGEIIIRADDGARHFGFSYFRIHPGGHSTPNDVHAHEHGVTTSKGGRWSSWKSNSMKLARMTFSIFQPRSTIH